MENTEGKNTGEHNEPGKAALAIASPSSTPDRIKQKTGPGWFATFILCALFSVGSVAVYDHYYAQKFVAVDIKGYLAIQRDLFFAKKINEEELKEKIDHLEDVVKKIPKNKAVVMGDAVIKNVEVIKP